MNHGVAPWIRLVIAAFFALAASPAAAEETPSDDQPIVVGYKPAWFLMGGTTGGASFHEEGPGGFAGAEFSLLRTHRDWWVGGYLDATYDFRTRAPTASIGPEVGYMFMGLDGGVAVRRRNADFEPGVMGRLSATAGVFGLFGRFNYWPTVETYTIQAGATFKFPLFSPWGPGARRPDE